MFWPKNQKRYENLKSSFVILQNLMEDLGKEKFEGFLELRFSEGPYYILRQLNKKDRIFLKEESGRFVLVDKTLPEIYEKVSKEVVTINVYGMDHEQVEFLSGCLNSTPLYTNLSSEFTDFERLLGKLTRDRHNGYLEVFFLNAPIKPAYIFYRNGKINSVLWGDIQFNNQEEGIHEINLKLKENEGRFNVYQVETESSPMGNRIESKKEDTQLGEKEEATHPGQEPHPESVEIPEVFPALESAIEKVKKETTKVASEINDHEKPTLESEKNELETLSIFPYLDFAEALIHRVEEAVNERMGKNFFSKAFKKGLLNISDKYPFLDPFLAEFTYLDGKITFTSEATAIEFLKGIDAAIESMFEEMTLKERDNIQRNLKKSLRNFERDHHENIEILRVRTLMPTLFR